MQLPFRILPFRSLRFPLLGLLVLLGAGYFFMGRSADQGATLTIVPGDFREQVSVSGTVIAAQEVALGFAASGRISGTYARVGQRVERGSTIAEIENGDLIAGLSQKRSLLTEAQSKLTSLKTGTRPEEISIAVTAVANAEDALKNSIQSAYTISDDAVHNRVDSFFTNPRTIPKLSFSVSNAALKATVEQDRVVVEGVLAEWASLVAGLTSDNVIESTKRAHAYLAHVSALLADLNLALNQGIPDQTTTASTLAGYVTTLAVARTNVNTAATSLTNDAASLNAAKSTLALRLAGSTVDSILAQEAAVAAAEADVRSAEAVLAKTRVTAPFSGVVTRMDAKVGEIVSPNTSEISIQSDGIFQIETFVPEVAIARIVPRNKATTTLDAYGPSATFPSFVLSVDPAETVKEGVPTYKTTLSFNGPDARIRSGMTANVVIETGVLSDAIVIPRGAVGTKNGTSYVSVIENEKTISRTVVTGASPSLGQVHILSGLSKGDTILLSPEP